MIGIGISIAESLVGLRIEKVVGYRMHNKDKDFDVRFILFDDKETIMEFEEQDYYTYHDSNSFARTATLRKDSSYWERINRDEYYWPPCNTSFGYSWIS